MLAVTASQKPLRLWSALQFSQRMAKRSCLSTSIINIYYIYRYFLFKQISNFLEHSLEVFFFNSYGILRTRKLAAEKKYSVRKKKITTYLDASKNLADWADLSTLQQNFCCCYCFIMSWACRLTWNRSSLLVLKSWATKFNQSD